MTVYDYDTSEALDGEATEELIVESMATDTGAVSAVLRDDVWEYVRPQDHSHPMYACETIHTVYVA